MPLKISRSYKVYQFLFIPLLIIFSCSKKIENQPGSLFPIKEYGKWGYINTRGEIRIKCQFDDVRNFSEGLAAIREDSLFGFIDTTGKMVIPPKFYSVANFSDGLCKVRIKKDNSLKEAFINKDGNIALFCNYEETSSFNSGRAEVKINNEVCYINKKGRIVFNTHYPYGSGGFSEGIAHVWGGQGAWVREGLSEVWKGDTTKYFDTSGNVIKVLEGLGHGDFSEGVANLWENDQSFYIDKTGQKILTPLDQTLSYSKFSNGLAKVTSAFGAYRQSGFIDIEGNVVIPLNYKDINDFKEGFAAFKENGLWGFIDKKGNVVIRPKFEQVASVGFFNGLCKVKQKHQWGYINNFGEFIWKEQVGIEYEKLDFKKWQLETLSRNSVIYYDIYRTEDNYPRKGNFSDLAGLTLKIDTVDLTVYWDRYFANKLYLINASKDCILIPAQDGKIDIIQQAINKKGRWQDIQKHLKSFCGNSYHEITFGPNEFEIFAIPVYTGDYKTKLRFKLEFDDRKIYSNTYQGEISSKQFDGSR